MSGSPSPALLTDAHTRAWGVDPTWIVSAPGTLAWLGEYVAPIGGTTIAQTIEPSVQVAISLTTTPPQGNHDQLNTSEAGMSFGVHSAGPHPIADADDVVRTVLDTVAHQQSGLRRSTPLYVTIMSSIPSGEGFGKHAAATAAITMALATALSGKDDPPCPPTLATLTAKALQQSAHSPTSWWRPSVIFRSQPGTLTHLTQFDDAVTALPFTDEREPLHPVMLSATPTDEDLDHTQSWASKAQRNDAFLWRACSTFGVETLRDLPSAPQRVLEWLDISRRDTAADEQQPDYPSVLETRRWLQLCGRDSSRARDAAMDVKSRRTIRVASTLTTSGRELIELVSAATPAQQRILRHIATPAGCDVIGEIPGQRIVAARPIPGASTSVLALVKPKKDEHQPQTGDKMRSDGPGSEGARNDGITVTELSFAEPAHMQPPHMDSE
ncbi:hypothetical protein [Corynebacterium kroppenstedtii]|uniref:Uncharacterized protein n=1 Tax=Corynebacterium kroppenstedtii TaxID=161879 RepID=A0A2W5V1H7_9CORY|nr:hypothetical protein [Corynebacterium kroppenstedtii]MDU7287234.1 hypothetical protein [Corynebacterium kroppenstedtii]PZR03801.1 MAG: hypothetical protein DI525_09005 [Corynebacterium kroppenstedtii]